MIKRSSFFILVFGLILFNQALAWDGLNLKGELWSRGTVDFHQKRPFEDTTSDHETFLLQGEGDLRDDLSFKAGARLDRLAFHGHQSTNEDTRLELWETYLRYQGENLELTVGNQIIRWGKTDEMTILDNLNPQDLRELMTLRLEERKRPWPWLRIQYYGLPVTLEGVFTLWPVWHIKNDFGTDWAVFDHLKAQLENIPQLSNWARSITVDKERPGPSLRAAEWGFRLSGTISTVDWEISFLHAHNRSFYYYIKSFPVTGLWINSPSNFTLTPGINITGNTIYISRPEDNIFGFAFETTLGDAGFRGEFAYHTDQVFLRKDLLSIRKPCWQYVLGIDYEFANGLYINMQFSQRYIQEWNNTLLFDPKWDSSIFLRLSKSFWQDFLEARIDAYYDITERMYYFNPEIDYKLRDNINLFVGVHLLDGPQGTFFDPYDCNDQAYLGLKVIL